MKNIAVLALIGAANTKVAPIPTDLKKWPVYDTPAAPATKDQTEDAAGNVLEKFSTSTKTKANLGPYRAYRNDLYVFPTQKVVKNKS